MKVYKLIEEYPIKIARIAALGFWWVGQAWTMRRKSLAIVD